MTGVGHTNTRQCTTHNRQISYSIIPAQSVAAVVRKHRVVQLDQFDAVSWEHNTPPLIISTTLLTAGATTDRPSTIHDLYGFTMLSLPVLDDEFQARIEGVYRQAVANAVATRISGQKGKAVLTHGLSAEHLVAKVDHIVFVAISDHHDGGDFLASDVYTSRSG